MTTNYNLRKLDALVAGRIFERPYLDEPTYCPNYSAHIADAWQVVERIVNTIKPRSSFIVPEVRIQNNAKGWTVGINGFHKAKAQTLSLAICLAALRAVGVTEEELETLNHDRSGDEP